MKRKEFMQLTSALIAAPLVASLEGLAQTTPLQNWAGNLSFSTNNVYYPNTVSEVQDLVKKCTYLRPLGTRHCFNTIADSKQNLISTKALNKVVSLDKNNLTVTVESGIKYGELAPYLHEQGFALHNLASLPHISVGGSITTATHGSGVGNGNLAAAVRGIELVLADGSVLQLTKEKDGEKFNAAVVGLGALGIMTKVTLAIEPTYQVRQHVFTGMPMKALKDNFNKIVGAGYSVSLFTDWQTPNINEVWIKSRVDNGVNYDGVKDFFGAQAATTNLHPIATLSPVNCTEQMGVPGPWHERLPHFKMGFTPSSGVELQSEYFIPMQQATDAIFAIAALGKVIGPHLFISEIRTIAADNFWMSPHYQQASVAIHFTWQQHIPEVMALLPLVEKKLEHFNAKPHWGKLFTITPAVLANRYKKMEDFKAMVATLDPAQKFRNEFLSRNLYTV
ncbi:MAG: FAD-binding protein [Bacteroidota bacterium]